MFKSKEQKNYVKNIIFDFDGVILDSVKLKNKAFQKNHVVIIHREKSTNDNFEEILETILTKKYGRSKIIFGCFI